MRLVLKPVFPLLALILTSLALFHPLVSAQEVNQGDLASVLNGVNQSLDRGMTPIIRVGVNGAQGYDNPASLVAFIHALSEAGLHGSGDVYVIAGPNEPETEIWASPNCNINYGSLEHPNIDNINCVADGVTTYMNAVVAGASGTSRIKLLSPAFNIGSFVFPYLFRRMDSNGANWNGLDGIAANSYNIGGQTVTGFVEGALHDPLDPAFARVIASGKRIFLTEIGDFSSNFNRLATEITAIRNNDLYVAALLFDAFGTNPDPSFAYNRGAQAACHGSCDPKVGINFGTIYTAGDYALAQSLGMKFTLEILGTGGVQRPLSDINRLEYPCAYPPMEHEFHPLRPYPFNPCQPLIPIVAQSTNSCGDALDTTGSFTFRSQRDDQMPTQTLDTSNAYEVAHADPNVLYTCAGTTNMICAIRRIPIDIGIDLTNSFLPVIGYTQSQLDDTTAVNQYLSWYLNGTVQYSEGLDLSTNTPQNISRLIDFSGPIKKLLAQQSQTEIRHVLQHANDIHNYLIPAGPRLRWVPESDFRNMPLSSMEDIVGEVMVTLQSKVDRQIDLTHTYFPQDSDYPINFLKLYILRAPSSAPEPPTPFSDGRTYMAHVRETYSLADILKNYANPAPIYTSSPPGPGCYSPSNFIPYTACRLGPTNHVCQDPRGTITACCGIASSCPSTQTVLDTNPFDTSDTDRIIAYQDHYTQKGNEDASIVQFTWQELGGHYGNEVPTRNTEIIDNPDVPNVANNQVISSHNPYYFTPYSGQTLSPSDASMLDSANRAPAPSTPGSVAESENTSCGLKAVLNPGDNLTDKNGWAVKARLSYTGTFSYKADDETPNTIGSACGNGTGGCTGENVTCDIADCCPPVGSPFYNGECVPSKCPGTCTWHQRDIPIDSSIRTTVVTQSPFLKGIYNSLVSGTDSVLRRFLPAKTNELASGNKCSTEYLKGEDPLKSPEHNPVDTCVESVSSPATYEAAAPGGLPGGSYPADLGDHTDLPGNVRVNGTVGRTTANIYFPYLGSLFNYFLGSGCDPLNLQRILRPYGLSGSCQALTQNTQRKFVALVIGQSNAASFGDTRYTPGPNVYCLTGTTLAHANDPLCGTEGTGGSPWTRLGDLLMGTGRYDQVIFIPVAHGSSAVASFAPGGSFNAEIIQAISNASTAGLTINAVLWHQGETDAALGTSQAQYTIELNRVISSIRSASVSAPFYVAQATRCDPNSTPDNNRANIDNIRAAQANVASFGTNTVLGPDTDSIKTNSANIGTTLDGTDNRCHFSDAGLMLHARAWLSSLNNATTVGGGTCDIPAAGNCSPTGPLSIFGAAANQAAQVCNVESTGDTTALNPHCLIQYTHDPDYNGRDTNTGDYSVGLFQVNLLAHRVPPNSEYPQGLDCPSAFSNQANIIHCRSLSCFQTACSTNTIIADRQTLLDQCVAWFQNPVNSITYAYNLYTSQGNNWTPAWTADANRCNF